MAYKVIGKDFTPPDVKGKVTGRAKYAEDFRAEGMVFARLLTSPMPHGRVKSMDLSEALGMPGVVDILTADDVPSVPAPGSAILTNEPMFVGDPILAVAAVDETTAEDAIDKIKLELEPLPFTFDPLESLYPGGPDARTDGNISARGLPLQTIKWTARDFAAAGDDKLPQGKPAVEWSYGDIEAGFRSAALVLDETFVTAGLSHHSMEPRSAMAYWQNGKCYLHGSSQSQANMIPGLAELLGIETGDLVYIAEYCGGGFGSKGGPYPVMAVPAYLAKKTGRPVMMRISRAEEYAIGSARPGFQGRIRIAFRADGRISAVDLYIVQENGPYTGWGDYGSAADAVSLVYQPMAMRWRGISVETNTPPRGPQRGPGQNQIAAAIEPLIDKAAKELDIDRVEIRKINAPDSESRYGGKQGPVSSAYLHEVLTRGAKQFDWQQKKSLSGRRSGSKVTGIGVGTAFHSAGRSGYDGLVRITPDGKLHIHSGVGNLGTYSYGATARVAAEVLRYDWANCIIERGDSRKHLPWTSSQTGSNTSFTISRTNYVAAIDALQKIKEIAAGEFGGSADDYDVADEKVFRKAEPGSSLSYAEVAQKAIALGGKYCGNQVPEDIHEITKSALSGIAGTGLIGVARDNLEHNAMVPAFAAGFMQIELDIETGMYEIQDYLGVTDCGTVIHPQSLSQQVKGGAVMGIGLAAFERHVYDPQNGLPANVGFYQSKPPSYLDVPLEMQWDAVHEPDRLNPLGIKGIGEPVQGCAAAALLCAISDALGGHYFNRTPVVPDMIINAVAGRQ